MAIFIHGPDVSLQDFLEGAKTTLNATSAIQGGNIDLDHLWKNSETCSKQVGREAWLQRFEPDCAIVPWSRRQECRLLPPQLVGGALQLPGAHTAIQMPDGKHLRSVPAQILHGKLVLTCQESLVPSCQVEWCEQHTNLLVAEFDIQTPQHRLGHAMDAVSCCLRSLCAGLNKELHHLAVFIVHGLCRLRLIKRNLETCATLLWLAEHMPLQEQCSASHFEFTPLTPSHRWVMGFNIE